MLGTWAKEPPNRLARLHPDVSLDAQQIHEIDRVDLPQLGMLHVVKVSALVFHEETASCILSRLAHIVQRRRWPMRE